jgi:outer membrane protein assembly factor BamB
VGELWGGPTVAADGAVLVGARTNGEYRVVALDPSQGRTLWTEADGPGTGTLVLVPGGSTVVCGGTLGTNFTVTARDTRTGAIVWRQSRSGVRGWAPFAATADGRVHVWEDSSQRFYVSWFNPPWFWDYMGRVLAFDAQQGGLLDTSPNELGLKAIDGVCFQSPAAFDRLDRRASVEMVDIWPHRYRIENEVGCVNRGGYLIRSGVAGGTAVDVDRALLTTGSFDEFHLVWSGSWYDPVWNVGCLVQRLDPNTGGPTWSLTLSNRWITAPAIGADGTLWYGTDDGWLVGRAAASGLARFALPLGGPPTTPPLLTDDGTLLVGSEDGRLIAVRSPSGPPVVSWPHAAGDGRNGQSLALAGEGAPAFRGVSARRVLAAGSALRLLPHVTGASPMAWQWYQDDRALAGATNRLLELTKVEALHAGAYTLAASNAWGRTTGAVASIALGFRLEAACTGQGELNVPASGLVLEPGTVYAVRATPRPGKRFLGWWGDPPQTNAVLAVTMDRDRTVHGVFTGNGGELRWTAPDLGSSPQAPALAVDGTAYRATRKCRLYALAPLDGRIRWSRELGREPSTAPVLARDDRLVVGLQAGRIAAFDPRDGAPCWQATLGAPNVAALAADDHALYARLSDGRLASLSLEDGAVRWTTPTRTDAQAGLALGSGHDLFVATAGPACLRLDTRTGETLTRIADDEAGRTPPALGADGTVFFAVDRLAFYAAAADSGRVRWQTNVAQLLPIAPVVDRNGSVICASRNALHVLDGRTGATVATVPAAATTAPVLGEGDLAFFGVGRNLACGHLPSGTVRWSLTLPNGYYAAQPALNADGGLVLGTHTYWELTGDVVCVESGSGPQAGAAWPQPGADARNNGRLPAAFRQPCLDAIRHGAQIEVQAHDLTPGSWAIDGATSLAPPVVWSERAVLAAPAGTYGTATGGDSLFLRLRARP